MSKPIRIVVEPIFEDGNSPSYKSTIYLCTEGGKNGELGNILIDIFHPQFNSDGLTTFVDEFINPIWGSSTSDKAFRFRQMRNVFGDASVALTHAENEIAKIFGNGYLRNVEKIVSNVSYVLSPEQQDLPIEYISQN